MIPLYAEMADSSCLPSLVSSVAACAFSSNVTIPGAGTGSISSLPALPSFRVPANSALQVRRKVPSSTGLSSPWTGARPVLRFRPRSSGTARHEQACRYA